MNYILSLTFCVFSLLINAQNIDPSYNSGGPVSKAQASIDIQRYDIRINLLPQEKAIDASTKISWNQLSESEWVEFDLDTVFQVEWIKAMKSETKGKSVSFTRKRGKIIIESKKGFKEGKEYQYLIKYRGKPREAIKAPWNGGFLWDEDDRGKEWIGVSCQINGGDLWFPCKDQQNDVAESASITIEVPFGLSAISNGLLIKEESTTKTNIFYWETNYPINNYNITLNIGDYEKIEDNYTSITGKQIPIAFYRIQGSKQDEKDLFRQYKRMLGFMEEKVGPYPCQNEKSSFINAPYIGMEHQTVLSLSKEVKVNGAMYNYVLMHELAHEWFGNQSTAANWGNLFLHEGLATYFEILFHEENASPRAYWNRVKHEMSQATNKFPMVLNGEEYSQDFFFRDTDYISKGVGFLHVLRSLLGDEAFFKGIKNYVGDTQKHQFTTTKDFQDAMEKAYGKSLQHYFDIYCYQASLPKLQVTVEKNRVAFEWINGEQIPIEIKYKGEVISLDMSKSVSTYPIAYRESFEVDPNNKLFMDKKEIRHMPFFKKEDMLDHMIGQMLIVGVRGTKPQQDPELLKDIRDGKVGGVVLYEKNIDKKDPKNGFKVLIDSLHAASGLLPFLVSIDQEGGAVNRLKSKYGYPESVSATYLGNLDNLDSTRHYAQITAKECDALGINVNFTPVLDLCKNKDNPIIAKYERCYSDDPERVARHARAVVQGHHEYNVYTVVKHFPGHGSSDADTHEGMADVTNYWGEEELIPFKRLIDAKMCDAVMTAHIVNRNICDGNYPATFSKKVNQELLRDEMGFDGVIFSDDMQMKAVSKHYGTKEAIKLTINSGVDFLMFSNNIGGVSEQTVDEVYRLIHELIDEGAISYERIEKSYLRIIAFKSQFSQVN